MKISNEAQVGALVFAVFLALAVLTFKTGDFSLSKKGYTVKIHFQNIDGVSLNAPVMLNGLEVGKVEAISILEEPEETKLELLAWIEEGVQLLLEGIEHWKEATVWTPDLIKKETKDWFESLS